jgi:hypothetical protein
LRFFEIFRSNFRKYVYGVFGLLMQRNGQKRDKKNRWEKTTRKKVFFCNFFGQKFLTWTFPKKCFLVFLNWALNHEQRCHMTRCTCPVPGGLGVSRRQCRTCSADDSEGRALYKKAPFGASCHFFLGPSLAATQHSVNASLSVD